jgi:hypothetical protein
MLVVCLLAMLPAVSRASNSALPSLAAREARTRPFLGFEANRGQADARARYVWRGRDAAMLFADDEVAVAVAPGGGTRMRFVGASPRATVAADEALPGRTNYLVGRDRSRWVTDVPTFARLRYAGVYPGVDFVVYGSDEGVEYDFVVAPGADARAVALAFPGSRRASIDVDGSLVLATAGGEVRHLAPRAYEVAGGARRAVACRFALATDGSVRFDVAGRDPSLALVIDPVVRFSTYFGGSNADRGQAIALDTFGDVYVAGRTFSSDYPTAGEFQAFNAGNYDVFVTKLDPTGQTVVYSTYVGGGEFDSAQAIAVTNSGEAWFAGYTGSTDFPAGLALPFQGSNDGGIDAVVGRLGAAGNTLEISSYLGGATTDQALGVALDASGNAYVAGLTNSNDLATVSAIQGSYGGGAHDGFYAEVLAGGALAHLSYIGGVGDDSASAVAVDSSANVYLTGSTGGGFPLLTPFQTNFGGTSDAFVTKVNAGLAAYAYSSYLGGSAADVGTGIGVDPSGNAYVAGYTISTNFPTTIPFQASKGANNDAFVTKVNAAGSAKVYSSYLGGDGDDRGNAIAVDRYGSAYVVGQTRSTNFPTVVALQASNGGNLLNDAFVTKVGASGRILIYSTYYGGSSTDVAFGVAVDTALTAYVTGYSDSANFPRVAAIQVDNAGVDDMVAAAFVEPGDTPGVFVPGTQAWFLRNQSSSGPADIAFTYGFAGTLVPLAGDWNGDGLDTPGLYDPSTGTFYLRNANSGGSANLTFTFGAPGAGLVPLAGDWNGDGVDSIGLYNPTTGVFFLKNANASGPADFAFSYGPVAGTIVPVTGDWNGDGVDTIGVYDTVTSAWFLRDANSAGPASVTFTFGGGGLTPVPGDFNADGIDTPGLYDPTTSSWFLRNANSSGPADVVFGYGAPGSRPIVGDWNR